MEPAIQVSPVKEEDMSFVRKVFEDMANNVLAATALSAQVQEMQRNVDTLSGTVEKLKTDVTYYSDQAHAFRRKSEELQGELDVGRRALTEASDSLNRSNRENEGFRKDVEHLNGHVATITKDRDDAQIRVMELEDQNMRLSDKLDKIKGFASSLFSEDAKSEPVHLPQFVDPRHDPRPDDAYPQGYTSRTGDPSVPLSEATPEPAPSPPVIDSNDRSFDWSRPYIWSDIRNAYVYS